MKNFERRNQQLISQGKEPLLEEEKEQFTKKVKKTGVFVVELMIVYLLFIVGITVISTL